MDIFPKLLPLALGCLTLVPALAQADTFQPRDSLETFSDKYSTPVENNPRRIVSEYGIYLGRLDALSTYLSPLNYHGFRPALAGVWSKGMPFSPEKWRMRFEAEIGGVRLINGPATAYEYNLSARFSWGMERVWKVGGDWIFTCGGNVGFDGGVLYLTRNSNNPVSLPIRAGISLVGEAGYDFRMGRLPITLSERAELASLGAFFMPGYGESYYEIYLGNLSGLVHLGWWGNSPALRSHFEVTLHFTPRQALAVGYLLNINQQKANNLKNRLLTNAFTLSWVR